MKQSSAIILVLVAISTAALILYNTKEGFWDLPSRCSRVEKVYTNDNVDFWQVPNFQGNLTPRMSGDATYGARMRTNLPSYGKLAVPSHPLGDDDDVNIPSEGFGPSSGPKRKQTITYDRYIFANKKSRLRGMADPIRGDLAIIPMSGNWFAPSVHPNIDLHAGSLNVMGGSDNENSHKVARLIYETSGGANSAIGGIDISQRNTATTQMSSGGGGNDNVIVTAFP
jgi:Family of unknown function (DUF5850)